MNKRTMLILAGLLVLQMVLAVVLWWPRQATASNEPLFAGLTVEQITELTVSDSAGQAVRLARQGEGWVLPEADAYPADGARIEAALTKLLAVTRGAPVTETAASQARLQVADSDFVRRIALQTADGADRSLLLGASPALDDSYLRLPGEDQVYQGRGLTSWEWSSAPSGWVDTLYVNVPLDTVASLTISNAQGDLRLLRRDDGGWALDGAPTDYVLDDTAVNTLVQRATMVRLSAPLGKTLQPAYGLDAPLATVTIETDAGAHTLLVGAVQGDGDYALKASGSDYVVSAAPYAVQGWIEATVESLRRQEQPAAQ